MGLINEAVKLSRWKDVFPFTIPVTIFGYILGLIDNKADLGHLVIILAANLLAVTFAFVFNELEDYEDDGKKINVTLAKLMSLVTFVFALYLYTLIGFYPFIFGLTTLLLGFLYSWKKVRLKAYPIVDVTSHCLMLGGLLFLSAFYISNPSLGKAIVLFIVICATSSYGQLYNQVRDFKLDKKAGLKNTAILLGKLPASLLMYACLTTALLFILYSFISGLLPLWLLILGVLLSPLGLFAKNWNLQKRDFNSGVPTNSLHFPFLLLLNLLSIIFALKHLLP